jgi:Ribonuclease G/E
MSILNQNWRKSKKIAKRHNREAGKNVAEQKKLIKKYARDPDNKIVKDIMIRVANWF